jgi:Fuc2NAc and GlcNAc transferase
VRGLAAAALALGFSGVLGLIGALDDLLDLRAKGKLAVQVVIALVFAAVVRRIDVLPLGFGMALPLGIVAGSIGTALWLVVTTNAVNFMDGANGLCVGSMAIALAALGAAGLAQGEPAVAGAAFAGAAAHLGFLPWNLPMRRMFQGDAGSLFSGFLAASLAVLAAGRITLYLMPFALTPFLTDVLLTLLIRARRGQSLFQAHSAPLFQLWLRTTGKSHGALALRVWGLVGLYALAGLGAEAAPSAWRPVLFALGVVVAAVGWRVIRRRLERASIPSSSGAARSA